MDPKVGQDGTAPIGTKTPDDQSRSMPLCQSKFKWSIIL